MSEDELTREQNPHSTKPDDRAGIGDDLSELETHALGAPAMGSEFAGVAADGKPVCQYRPGGTIGRYIVVRELGTGGFGHVLLCKDPKLLRQVAIKFPRSDRLDLARHSFLEEGRSVARLDHPSIVKVYDIEETPDGLPFAVMEFVEGPTLHEFINAEGMKFSVSLKLLIQIAEALEYAHSRTLIHRDLKPANVIITKNRDRAKLMDFGMALHDMTPEENLTGIPEGTPPYMSPEQIRGENHRLDCRTDIWGFGAMMYVMLTGQRPFVAKDKRSLVDLICFSDPSPPGRINRDVPKELERICLKCLEKLMNSRYQSATELIEDLKTFGSEWDSSMQHMPEHTVSGVLPLADRSHHSWSNSKSGREYSNVSGLGHGQGVKVVPKGLRSFDAQDADFFLDLLPGPKDRFGIPDSLRFWLNKLAPDSIEPLTVGLIFGPSGCGKSSLVKAGLLPRLPPEYNTIYLEATPNETEKSLLAKIGTLAPEVVSGNPGISVALSRIRRGQLPEGQKLLIVIDQFEQWLQANTDQEQQQLVEALRHCDSEHLSCILLVRDDFWMSATRFMSQLDLKVQEGVNALGIPLFDRRHARKVLTAYGQANEALGEVLTADQQKFIASTVREISDHDQIIPIHLALFAQMMDSDSWQSSKLKQLGGWQGLGVQFLEKISTDKRVARQAETFRTVLRLLLPDSTSEIKGAQKSLSELARATELEGRLNELQSFMDFLDREVRIVTSTETENDEDGQPHYQLTHDFLVNPIRKWIALKEKQTWQGRANIRLGELARQWEPNRDSRFLPGAIEYVAMQFGVDHRTGTDAEKAFFKTASRYYGLRAAVLLMVLFGLVFAGQYSSNQTTSRIARVKVDSLLAATPEEFEARLENLEQFDARIVRSQLEAAMENPVGEQARLHALMARSRICPVDEIPVDELVKSIRLAEGGECRNIVAALKRIVESDRNSELQSTLNSHIQAAGSDVERIRLAIVSLYLGESEPAIDLLQLKANPEQRERFIEIFPDWHGDLEEACGIVRAAKNPWLLTGLLKSIGQLPAERITAAQRKELVAIANEKIRNAEMPVVFSTCQWLLQKSGQAIPDNISKASNGSWLVRRFEGHPPLIFLRVDPQIVPGRKQGVPERDLARFRIVEGDAEDTALEKGFYMASAEVPASLFFEFLSTLPPDQESRKYFETNMSELGANLDAELPAYNVTWSEAIRFCNWLSTRDNREPAYESFKFEKDGSPSWRPIPGANGYRLPKILQWEAANRAGTRTRFPFGNSTSRLSSHAITSFHKFEFKDIFVGVSKQKIPNDYGFFDLLGNASEWCEDEVEVGTDRFYGKALRGADAVSSSLLYFSSGALFQPQANSNRSDQAGIRLVLPIDE